MKKFVVRHKYILLILLLALILRLIGIKHGFPYIFHPDEPALVRTALGMRFKINPEHFDWPHLFTYLNFFVYGVFAKGRDILTAVGLRPFFSNLFPLMWNEHLIFYLISRIFAATVGALTVIPVYLVGKKLFNEKTGLFAALGMAMIPFHVKHSHYALIDVPATFFVAWVIYFSALILFNKNLRNYLLAGLFVGFAASTKYNGALSAITVPLAHVFRVFSLKERFLDFRGIRNLALSGIAALAGFLIGTPFALLDYKRFSITDSAVGAYWQFENVGSVGFSDRLYNFYDQMVTWYLLPSNLGFTLLIGFWIVLVIAVVQIIRRKATKQSLNLWLVLIPALALLLYVSGFSRLKTHYFIFIYPFVALPAGYFAYLLYEWLKKYKKWLAVLVLALYFLPPLIHSGQKIAELTAPVEITEKTEIWGGDLGED
jgi:asparagine N-glycosylation enzyme membrane subunit Stt3